MKGEEIIVTGKVHWWIFSRGAFCAFFGILLAIFSDANTPGTVIGWFMVFIGAIALLNAAIYTFTTELALTNKRIIAKFGLIRRRTIELTHKNVESLGVNQSIFGRLLNFGSIRIYGTGGSKAPIRRISAPLEFRMKANDIIEAEQR